jgi:signal peptidase II
MTRTASRLVLLILVVATVGCDRVTKHLASATLADAPRQSFLADTLRLEYAENTGGFLGLGAEWPQPVRTALFTVGNGLLLLAMVVVAVKLRWSGPAVIGLTLFVAGGASNLMDRLARGSVVDFLNLGVGSVRTGIFNVADVALMLGAAIVVFGWRTGAADADGSHHAGR